MSFSSYFAKPRFDSLKTIWIPLTSTILATMLLFAYRNSTGVVGQSNSSEEEKNKEPIVLERNLVWDRMMALQWQANQPNNDRVCCKQFKNINGYCASVFDGNNGW